MSSNEIRLTTEYKLKEQNIIDKKLMTHQAKLTKHETLLQSYISAKFATNQIINLS
jgi:hypothetical protein